MSKNTKKLVPKLRFPEFRDAGEWELLPIGEKIDLLSGYPFKSAEISEDSTGIPLMRGINITEGFVRHTKDIDRYFLGETTKLEKYKLRKNDLVIGMDGSKVGKNSALITDSDAGALLIQRVARLRSKKDETINFIFQHIHSPKFHAYVDRINTSGGIPHISADQINQFVIGFPREKEQQKIADCLSSIDDLITAQSQKVEALKTHKKGLMQQLFPREGETVPRLRFPEFRNAGEWEEKDLSNFSECGLSNGVFNDPKKVGRGYKLVNVLDMYIDTVIDETKLSLVELSENEFLKNKVENGDIFFTRSSLVKSGIAYSNIYTGKSSDITFDGHLIRFRPNKKILFPMFANYLLRTSKVRSQLVARGKSATMTTIGQADVAGVKLTVPTTINEQQKIADCLSSIDDLITAQTQKLETLKTHKKGLMQQLFPNTEAESE